MVKEKADGTRRRLQDPGEPQDGSRNPYWCTGTLYCILTGTDFRQQSDQRHAKKSF